MRRPQRLGHQVTDSSGEDLPGWGCSITWSPDGDVLEARWWREDTLRRRGKSKVTIIESGNVEDALAKMQVAARTLSARRLF